MSAETSQILRLGSTGDDVIRLQENINAINIYPVTYNLEVDGTFGSETETAVKDIQERHGLQVDGIVGPETWDAVEKSIGG